MSGTPDRPVRVLLVAPSLDMIGGQSIQASRLRRGLAALPSLDVGFLAVNPRLGPFGFLKRIKYVRTLATTAAYVVSLLFRVPRADVVHAFSASYWSFLLAPLPALVIAHVFGKRTVLNYRSGEADDHLTRWRRTVPKWIRRFADVVVAPSGYLVDVFSRHGLAARAIVNFVELEAVNHRLRTPLQPRLLSNRNLEALYDVETTIRAFAVVQSSFPEATLTLAGDGPERHRLEELVGQLDLRNVTFLGRVAPDRMPTLYDAADIYINSPRIDNMPSSIIEAFAAGTPVVTTNAGGIPYIVEEGRTGLMVAVGDAAALAAAVIRLLHNPNLATGLAREARREVEERYTWTRVAHEWEALYCDLCATPDGSTTAMNHRRLTPVSGAHDS